MNTYEIIPEEQGSFFSDHNILIRQAIGCMLQFCTNVFDLFFVCFQIKGRVVNHEHFDDSKTFFAFHSGYLFNTMQHEVKLAIFFNSLFLVGSLTP